MIEHGSYPGFKIDRPRHQQKIVTKEWILDSIRDDEVKDWRDYEVTYVC